MNSESQIVSLEAIQSMIIPVCGVQVMLDRDLARLYGVDVKRLNQQVNRNIERFPERFMHQLTNKEFEDLKSQIATSSLGEGAAHLKSQIATSSWGGVRRRCSSSARRSRMLGGRPFPRPRWGLKRSRDFSGFSARLQKSARNMAESVRRNDAERILTFS